MMQSLNLVLARIVGQWKHYPLYLSLSLSLLPTAVTGCGGGRMTQADMKRRAIRRPSDDEGEQTASSPKKEDVPAGTVADAGKVNLADKNGRQRPAVRQSASNNPTSTASVKPAAEVSEAALPVAKTVQESRERSARNLAKIAQALHAYSRHNGAYPKPAIGNQGEELLSWRVAILPELGYKALYDSFKLSDPWDSPHNVSLLNKIPNVFRSPDRLDNTTNYLVPVGSATLFGPSLKGVTPRNVEDGIRSTIAVIEVDDELAVPWTQPVEYKYDPLQGFPGLGGLREKHFFAGWADGSTSQVPINIAEAKIRGAFSIDGGETIDRATLRKRIDLRVKLSSTISVGKQPLPNDADEAKLAGAALSADKSGGVRVDMKTVEVNESPQPSRIGAATVEANDRPSQPSATETGRARSLLRKIYEKDWKEANTPADRVKVAKKMAERADAITEDLSGKLALLEIARDIAVDSGDADLAVQCCQRIGKAFRVDGNQLSVEALAKMANRKPRTGGSIRRVGSSRTRLRGTHRAPGAGTIVKLAKTIIDDCMKSEHYDTAEEAARVLVTASKNNGADQDRLTAILDHQREVQQYRSAYRAAEASYGKLEQQPDHGGSLFLLGNYLCLYRGDWQNGLPMLAKSNHDRLVEISTIELKAEKTVEDKFHLADLWWRTAQSQSMVERANMQKRAAFWYKRLLDQLPNGLDKIKAEKRMALVAQEAEEKKKDRARF